ncbi:MAG: TetR family transcriptional regulator, partial [Actinomycetota bacterium]|nr:TetR family transcriptional regulator [Actinomycetota bacterium]
MARDRAGTSARRLPWPARREQILAAATTSFAQAGFTATSLEDVAAAAGITRAIVYRHFQSKTELYRAVLDRARDRLQEAGGDPPYTARIIDDLVAAAAADPDGFRLLFHHAGREPAFRADVDRLTAAMAPLAHEHLAQAIPDPAWARWAAQLAPAVTIAAITAWLDAGLPDPTSAADRIRHAARGIADAARLQPNQ